MDIPCIWADDGTDTPGKRLTFDTYRTKTRFNFTATMSEIWRPCLHESDVDMQKIPSKT
jgi:hypothetical protein